MRYLAFFILSLLCACQPQLQEVNINRKDADAVKPAYAMVIHGGAGTITKANLSEEKEKAIRAKLEEALIKGEAMLKANKPALDVVEAVIHILEDSHHFNAGKGAVFNHGAKNEMDASIMSGLDLKAGAVGGVGVIKHPISAARAVMEKSVHVMLSGEGAEEFSREHGLEIVDPSYFYTEDRMESLKRVKAKENKKLTEQEKHGTVGCAVLDAEGNLAAGTSTGGMTNKRWNRIGDSPIIGAGTYANNKTCAVSCTGHGEFFIRYAVAHDVSAMMEYKKVSLQEAGNEIINVKLKNAGGTGGFVAVDKDGNIAMPFNTEGMYRAYIKPGEKVVQIYKD